MQTGTRAVITAAVDCLLANIIGSPGYAGQLRWRNETCGSLEGGGGGDLAKSVTLRRHATVIVER